MLIVGLFAGYKTSTALEHILRNQSGTIAMNLAESIDTILQEEIKLARTMAVNDFIISAASRVSILGIEKSIGPIVSVYRYLNAAMERLGENYENILSGVAAAMEEASTNTNIVASAAEEMSASISEISKNAEKGRLMSEMASTQSTNASEKMSLLNHAAKKLAKLQKPLLKFPNRLICLHSMPP